MKVVGLEFEINEENIAKQIEQDLARTILSEAYNEMRADAKRGVKVAVEKAVKEYIYVNKDEIVEKVIARATTEIVKKGIPQLLEQMNGEWQHER